MQPTFTHDDVLTMRRSLQGYIVYLRALYSADSDEGKQREIARAEDLHRRLGDIVIP